MDTADNRREFFRVQDVVALHYETVPEKLADDDPAGLVPEDFQVLAELQRIAVESRHLLRQIHDEHRTIADFLRLQDARLDLLTRAFARNAPELEYLPRRPVNLSEGGIEFVDDRALAPGQLLLLRVMLFPEQTPLALFGRVIHVEVGDRPGTYSLGVEFTKMTDGDRQILARHALHLQSEERRERGSGVS